ncbi:MAG: MFS transporter, partial [Myxococcales bacterium]|nr:MFS transporter [Myxococcales bacterium]
GYWPWFLAPFSLIGFLLCLRIWNAKPKPKTEAAPQVAAPRAEEARPKTGTE